MKIFLTTLFMLLALTSVVTAGDFDLELEAEMLIKTTNKGNRTIARLLSSNDNASANKPAGYLDLGGQCFLPPDYTFSYAWERKGDFIFRKVVLFDTMPVINNQGKWGSDEVDQLEYHIYFLVKINLKTQIISFKYLRYGNTMRASIKKGMLDTSHLEITRDACYKVVHNGSEFPFIKIKDNLSKKRITNNKWAVRNGYIKFPIKSEPGNKYQLLKIR